MKILSLKDVCWELCPKGCLRTAFIINRMISRRKQCFFAANSCFSAGPLYRRNCLQQSSVSFSPQTDFFKCVPTIPMSCPICLLIPRTSLFRNCIKPIGSFSIAHPRPTIVTLFEDKWKCRLGNPWSSWAPRVCCGKFYTVVSICHKQGCGNVWTFPLRWLGKVLAF